MVTIRCHNCQQVVDLPDLKFSKSPQVNFLKSLENTICPKCEKLIYSKKSLENEIKGIYD